jgi:hypothetical protein
MTPTKHLTASSILALLTLPSLAGSSAPADIGGFGVSSDLTRQALAALGYHINDDAAVVLGYRGIGTDYEDGSFAYDVISHSILLGFEYRF